MQRNFVDSVNELWQAVRDAAALTALLSDLRQLAPPCPPPAAVTPWFPPLLYRLLSPEELSCVLPLPCNDASPPGASLATALLRAVLLPMRANIINPDVTVQLIHALQYSLDANSGILAMISGPCPPLTPTLSPPTTSSHSADAKDFEHGFALPPVAPSWGSSLFAWTLAAALEQRRRPCSLSDFVRLLRADDRSMMQHIVTAADARPSLPDDQPPPPPCALCFDAAAAVHPCSRADGAHGLCGSCAVQSLRFALNQVRTQHAFQAHAALLPLTAHCLPELTPPTQSSLSPQPVTCPLCKAAHTAHPPAANAARAAAAPEALDGWFHPAAVDAVARWCADHAAELQEQDVAPISHHELRMCPPPFAFTTNFLSAF